MRYLFVCILIFLLFVSQTYAHPGSLDSNGGHHNRADGTYHYHTGENKSSSSASSKKYYYDNNMPKHKHSNGICPFATETKPTSKTTEQNGQSPWLGVVVFAIAYAWLGIALSVFVFQIIRSLADSALHRKESPFESVAITVASSAILFPFSVAFFVSSTYVIPFCVVGIIYILLLLWISYKYDKKEYALRQKEYDDQRNYYVHLYENVPMENLVTFPPNTIIGDAGLPKEKSSYLWGDTYTVYVSKTGTTYHKYGCNPRAFISIHMYRLSYDYRPCKRCNPQLLNMDWYDEYLEIISIKQKYHID